MNNKVIEVVNQRKIILGPKDKIKSSSLSKYSWAYTMFKDMQANEWLASGIDLSKDKLSNLNAGSKTGVDRALAFLTGLDGYQVDNLAINVVDHITDYTVKQCIYRQIYEEVNHVDAYDTIICSYYNDPTAIYLMHENNEILHKKNEYVLAQASEMTLEFNVENFICAVVSNIILEGVYFHSGFLLFYVIDRMQRELSGAAEMIQYIQRDETTHLNLFTNIFHTLKEEFPNAFNAKLYNRLEKLFEGGIKLETDWGFHLIEEGVPALSNSNMENYIKSLGNDCLQGMGMASMYEVKNPYPWVKEYTALANKNEKNFFENKPNAYSKESLDFDDF